MWHKIKGATSVPFDSIVAILYGGQSITFKTHSKDALRKLRIVRAGRQDMSLVHDKRLNKLERTADI